MFVTYGLFAGVLGLGLVLPVIFVLALCCCFGLGIRQVCCVVYSWFCLFVGLMLMCYVLCVFGVAFCC